MNKQQEDQEQKSNPTDAEEQTQHSTSENEQEEAQNDVQSQEDEVAEESTDSAEPVEEVVAEKAEEATTEQEADDSNEDNAEAADPKPEVEAEKEETTAEKKEKKLETEDDLHSEDDESDDEEEDHEEELPDYSEFNREQLVEVIEELSHQTTFKRSDRILAEIVPLFEEKEQQLREEALNKYVADGGEEDSFEYRHDELYNRFDASHRLIKDRKHSYF